MTHLSPEELIDLAESTVPESSSAHLASCAACRQDLAELRGLLATVSDVDVPEPSPLFWDHLSARVREAVSLDATPARWRFGRLPWRLAAAMSAAAVVLAVSITMRTTREAPNAPAPIISNPVMTSGDGSGTSMADDPSLSLLVDLVDGLDLDAAAEVGLAMAAGTADSALSEMTDAERLELQRLLREALSNGGTL